MKKFWNQRYSETEYAYGKDPNAFFRNFLATSTKVGKALFPAEGEGRNAVFAAQKGWKVTAFDISEAGREKALRLAGEFGVNIQYLVGPLEDHHFSPAEFDLIVLTFAHFPQDLRAGYHKRFIDLLCPGAQIVLEGFSKSHLAHSSNNPQAGGPKDPAMLFSIEEIQKEFEGLEIVLLEEKELELAEGLYHKGTSSVIRFIGKKPV